MTGFDDIEFASLTDVGVRRSHNQDSHATLPAKDLEQWQSRGHLFMVADGMGAHAVGELASKLAADSMPHLYSKYAEEGPIAALRRAFIETNLAIHNRGQQNREFAGMGTTGTALLLRPEGAWVGHVGDSRCYRVRNGKIEQMSFDHSLVWELARRQNKKPEELHGVPTNVIVRSLGPEPLVAVDVEGPYTVQAGDHFVLCSDGLSGPVSDREIGAVVTTLPPDEACRFLIQLANLQGGPDNITAIVVRVTGKSSLNSTNNPGAAPSSDRLDARASAPTRSWLSVLPGPLLLIILGIVLGMVVVYQVAFGVPGQVLTFVLAALSLVSGLTWLMLQNVRENQAPPARTEPATAPHIYRTTPCAIDQSMLQKVSQAIEALEERVRERQWQADWEACERHLELARRHQRQGEWRDAFREFCRGMLLLMEAIHRQRNKEESFKPLWDRAPA